MDDDCSNEFTSKHLQIHSEVGSVTYMTAVFLMKWQIQVSHIRQCNELLDKIFEQTLLYIGGCSKSNRKPSDFSKWISYLIGNTEKYLKFISRPFKQ